MGIFFGLASAIAWGTSDFLGGRFTRTYPAFTVTLISYVTGLLLLLAVAAFVRPEIRGETVAWGLVAGVVTSFGGLALYQGLATGDAGIVATLSGCGAIIPVVVAFATGEAPTTVQTAGIVLALLGGVLASVPASGVKFSSDHHWRPVAFGVVAAVSFGLFFVLVDKGTQRDSDALVVLSVGRVGAIAVVGTVGAFAGGIRWPGRDVPRIALAGAIDIAANGAFALASTRGNVAVASVLASLYPVQTLVLARMFTEERFTLLRLGGVVLALAGVAAIAAG